MSQQPSRQPCLYYLNLTSATQDLWWNGHVAEVGKTGNEYGIFVGNLLECHNLENEKIRDQY
jgi:hypothetical protein